MTYTIVFQEYWFIVDTRSALPVYNNFTCNKINDTGKVKQELDAPCA